MKKRFILFTMLLLVVACSKDDYENNPTNPEPELQKELAEEVLEDLNDYLDNAGDVSYEQIQEHMKDYPNVTTYVEDDILHVTTEDGASFIIDNNDICSVKESSEKLQGSEEDIEALIKEINAALYPAEQGNAAMTEKTGTKSAKIKRASTASSTSASKGKRFLRGKKILIWSPWNINNAYAERIVNVCNLYNNDSRNKGKIQCVYKRGAEDCTLESMSQFSNYDIVLPICHGTPKGYIELPIVLKRRGDGKMEDVIDAQKRYLKAGYAIGVSYNPTTKKTEHSAIPSKAMLENNLPTSMKHTIMWTAICYACKSYTSVLRKICKEKDVAAFYGADSETSGNLATSLLQYFIPAFYSAGTAKSIIERSCQGDAVGYSEVVDVELNLKKYVEGRYHLENSNDYDVVHLFALPLKANPNPVGIVVAPQSINQRTRRLTAPHSLNVSSNNDEVGLCFTNTSTGEVTMVPFIESTVENYYVNNYSTLSTCYEVYCKTDMLEEGTYKYKTYIRIDGETTYSTEEYEFKKDDFLCPDNNHPHAIDMGAAGVWACCNVGASKPEDYGGYYAWGEIEEKSAYDWSTYKYWHDKNGDGSAQYGESDDLGDISGNKSYDVAAAKWGGRWRMPTLTQIQNLINNCSYKWIEVNGIYGGLFTASNGHRIFLPAAGARNGTELLKRGSLGRCWSSTPNPSDRVSVYYLHFISGSACWADNWYLYTGRSVRPVSE